jgi:hypothetical protein
MTNSERAWQVWPVLALAAGNRQLLTYERLGRMSGMHAAGLGAVLEFIQAYCLENHLPPLTVLVVNKATGAPSEGFIAASDVPRAFARVFEHDWGQTGCPSPAELERALHSFKRSRETDREAAPQSL